jgi:hypothetical protein
MYENARKKKKSKGFNDKQKAAHAMSRAVFGRARQIWEAVPNCDPYEALRTAWKEAKDGKLKPIFKNNPFYSNPGEFVDPSSEYSVQQIAGKFHIIDSDGEPTGKYFLSEEKAYDKAAKMNG